MSLTNTDWTGTTDIYDIVDSLNNLKKQYIEDEDETTLSLGIFGYITDTEAKKIQTSTIITGQMGNEMFPGRANLTKNVLAHAIYNNISDINAIPARMTLNIGIKVEDLDKYMIEEKFVFDMDAPIYVGDYEFHLDYDLVISRSIVANGSYVYAAHYDMDDINRLSTLTDAYINQPFVITIDNSKYVIFQVTVRQVTIETTQDKMVTNSVIDNKTYTFEFDNQIADFDVYVTDNGVTTKLQPLIYGSSTDGIENYCWYLFLSDNSIRIMFDSKSYIPGLNTSIEIRAFTTLGSAGVFNYKKIDESTEGFFIDINSEKYNYYSLACFVVAVSDSVDGSDRKSKEELQKLIPKAALSRGSITTETDISNYFNLIDSEENRLKMQKKVDNSISRVWYGYFLLKDDYGNIIPTNTITMRLNVNDGSMFMGEDGRYILPAGSILRYSASTGYGNVIDEADVPELYSDEYFEDGIYYYMTVYNIIINPDPLYAAFYLTITNNDTFFIFNWVNENCTLQFVANRCNFQRNLLTDQSQYRFTFNTAQSIKSNQDMYIEETIEELDPEKDELVKRVIVTNNMKAVLVLYKEDTPYRWTEAKFLSCDTQTWISSWQVDLETDNGLDDDNDIKIENLRVAGSGTDINYGYFSPNTKAVLYLLAKFNGTEFGRYDLDDIAPGCFDGYTVTNVYTVSGGLKFYENFTNVMDTRVNSLDNSGNYAVSGVPVVGMHYMTDEDHATYLVDAIDERKAYIEYCIDLLENNMDIDFKFFNTYGNSLTYTNGNDLDELVGHVDVSMKFRASLKSSSDIYTKDDLIRAIKSYIEDLYSSGDWHAPNMITDITNEFNSRINYLEFISFNEFGPGNQHINKIEVSDPHIVPEFINIRNKYNQDGELEPCIDIEIVVE